MPRASSPGETARQDADAGDHDPGLGAGDCLLEVLGKTTVSPEPREGPLDYPPPRLGLKRAHALAARDNLDRPFADVRDCVEQLGAAVDAVGEEVTQPAEPPTDSLQQRHRSMIVLDVGRMDLNREQPSFRVGHQMTLAPLHSLGRIKPPWTATFRGFGGLAVDDPGRGGGLASDRSASARQKSSVDAAPQLGVTPIVEVILNRRERREVLRQRAPLAPGGEEIKHCVEHGAKVDLPRPPHAFSPRKLARNQLPLGIGQITCVPQAIAAILFAGGFGPRHVVLPRRIATTKESQMAKTTQLLFGQALRRPLALASGRLEGWKQTRLWPPFETAAARPPQGDGGVCYHNCLLASRAPSRRASNFAQITVGCTSVV